MELNLNSLTVKPRLTVNEKEGLLIETISNKAELDEFEQLRILLPVTLKTPDCYLN